MLSARGKNLRPSQARLRHSEENYSPRRETICSVFLSVNETDHKTPSSVAKRAICDGSLAKESRKKGNAKSFHVRVTSRRSRLIDPDNLCAKYFVDCLRYAGFIPDDNADVITLEVRQEKVGRSEEETVIEVL